MCVMWINVYAYAYAYAYVYVHVHVHVYVHVHEHVYVYVCVYGYGYACVHVCACVCMCVHVCACVCIHMYIYMYIYICTYIYIYMYIVLQAAKADTPAGVCATPYSPILVCSSSYSFATSIAFILANSHSQLPFPYRVRACIAPGPAHRHKFTDRRPPCAFVRAHTGTRTHRLRTEPTRTHRLRGRTCVILRV